MDQTPASTPGVNVLHCALELSKNTWLLGIQFPDRLRPSPYPIDGGDTDKLMAKLIEARDRWAKVSGEAPAITVCYAGRPACTASENRSDRCGYAAACADLLGSR